MPLGYSPVVDDIILTAGACFSHRVTAAAGETIPTGTTAVIGIFPDAETDTAATAIWPAQVTAHYVEWFVTSDDADLVEGGSYYRMLVDYPLDPTPHCWYRGQVQREQ